MSAKACELRMVTVASSSSAQYRSSQQGFSPQRNQALRIEIARMNGPETHVTPNVRVERAEEQLDQAPRAPQWSGRLRRATAKPVPGRSNA